MDPARTLQYAIRDRLVNTAAVTSLVPATSILDLSARPELFPSIILGETQTMIGSNSLQRDVASVFLNLHIWTREQGMTELHGIMSAIRRAMRTSRFFETHNPNTMDDPENAICDAYLEDARTMRDPDGETAHGVLTVKGLIQESWVASL